MNVQLTSDYALTVDDRNFIVKARKIVDPTKAPGWAAKVAANPDTDASPREKWEDDGFYSLNSAGLAAAIESVIYRTVTNGAAAADYPDLAALISEIRTLHETLARSLDISVILPSK